jgi:hypothetical protein
MVTVLSNARTIGQSVFQRGCYNVDVPLGHAWMQRERQFASGKLFRARQMYRRESVPVKRKEMCRRVMVRSLYCGIPQSFNDGHSIGILGQKTRHDVVR